MTLTLAQNGRISLDPNLRPELMSLEQARFTLAPYLAAADLLLPTSGELGALTSLHAEAEALQALPLKDGAIAAVKKGSQGCSIYSQDSCWKIPGYAVQEIDPTGAGDCFSAAFIAGLQAGWSLERVGRFANAAGALAVTRLGPMEGAPILDQVNALMDTT
jgi:sugar/nucleoside kinase (ribokinase family)